MEYFVKEGSVVRQIWGKADTILFIFAGASAEFALNKAVDWLYFTGRLPADPLGRLFSTVTYARQIVFSEYEPAVQAIKKIVAIHSGVEKNRGAQIPEWAYRDVLFMLIDYSVRAYELLERKLTESEKSEVFDTFYGVGMHMGISGLPVNYGEWLTMRAEHLVNDMERSHFTEDLYKQYKVHLGTFRYEMLKQVQLAVAPRYVCKLLDLGRWSLIGPVLLLYKFFRILGLHTILRNLILPKNYKLEVIALDAEPKAYSILTKIK